MFFFSVLYCFLYSTVRYRMSKGGTFNYIYSFVIAMSISTRRPNKKKQKRDMKSSATNFLFIRHKPPLHRLVTTSYQLKLNELCQYQWRISVALQPASQRMLPRYSSPSQQCISTISTNTVFLARLTRPGGSSIQLKKNNEYNLRSIHINTVQFHQKEIIRISLLCDAK